MLTKKTGSSCAMPVDSMFISISFVGLSFLISRLIFSIGSISRQGKKSAAVLIFHAMCAMVKVNCNTKLQAFHKGGILNFVWKTWVND